MNILLHPADAPQKWGERRFWSLWDMLKLNAASFYQVTTTLDRVDQFIKRLPESVVRENMFEHGKRADLRNDLLADLALLKKDFNVLQVKISEMALDRVITLIE